MLYRCQERLRGVRLRLAARVLLWGLTATGGRAVVSAAPITNLLQLGRAAQAQPRLVGSVALEGTVWWSSAAAGRILLQADSSVAQLELALPDPMPQQGTRLRLEGECLVAKTRGAIKLSAIPVVDNDGLHGAAERSGSVYLPVGRHPIRVAWFNRAEHSELAVAYEGPDLPRQTIPAAVLFRAQVDRATGATNYVPGLDYRCCEGLWWSQLPNLAHLAVVSAGVVGGFDLAVRSREEQVGLQFSGSLQIAREGLYLFYTKSDDGSALFIGESSLQMKRLGPADWPPRPPGASPALAPAAEDYQWGEIEGTIGSVNRWADGLELEVVTAAGHLRVQVAEAPEGTCTLGPQNRIRAVGVCHYVRSLDGSRGLGEVYVQSWREITQRPATPGLAAAYLLVTDSNVLASPVLTLVEQVHQLSPEELQRDCPVKLRGVVTAALGPDAVVLQDTTRAIYVATTSPTAFQMGDFCEVEGIARPGEFNPYIVASRVEQLGAGLLPGAVHPTWDQLLNGSLHLQYVELEGVVTAMAGNTLTLLTHDGRIKVAVESLPVTLPATCRNALVRLRGLLFATWDRQTHRVDVGRISLNQPSMSVLRPAPDDPFALPTKNVDDLLRFDPQAGALQRVKVSGQLSYVGDEASFLRDGDKGLRFFPVAPLGERVGERVEVVGFPDLSGPSPVLQEAVVRRLGVAELPQPHKLAADSLVRDDYDATYVQVEGVLVGLTRKPEESVLDLQSGLRRFAARVQSEAGWPAFLGLGSRLALTGVYVGQGGNRVLAQPIDSFHLLVNSGHDLRVLSRPPWWTMKRSLTAVGVLAGVLLAALIWIKLLRSKVTERSRQLVGQIEQRERLERQRLVEQERARVAHDLHDDLGAGLTEVNMLTSLVKSPTTSAAEKARYLEGLNATALRMVTSLDEIVWAVNPSNDTIASLASYFAAYAQRFLELAGVACALEVAEDLPEYRLDSKFRHDVFLAFKEALNNVIRHAGATRVWLRISVPDCRLVVVVADNGRGIESGQPEAGADGLINMRERLRAMGGSCEIQSEPGQGTTVRLRAPLPRILP